MKYLEVAAQANEMAKKLLQIVPADKQPQAAEMIARLVNLGVRCSPRGVQSTVRFRAVERAVRDLPVKVKMQQVVKENGFKYNALVTEPTGGKPTIDDATDAEE